MARIKQPPRWYFSLRSPYSWFAYRDLRDNYPDVLDMIEWIPFWEPDETTQRMLDENGVDLPIVPMSRAKNFYILQDARRLAALRGLSMSWPIDSAPHWEIAHLGYIVASDAGLGREFVDLAYTARWQANLDISLRTTVAGIAQQLGLDPSAVANASDDPDVRARGVDCLTRSYKDGLFGVPFFIEGRDRYFGVDRLKAFVSAVRGQPVVPGETTTWFDDMIELPELVSAGGDAGHAGGCG